MRVIAATNTDLVARVEENKFREDLFYRLDVASLHIPPLRERAEDIPLLINYFLEKETISRDIPAKRFSDEAMVILQRHNWPGNIRELANTVAQAVLLSKGPIIFPEDLPSRIKPPSPEPAGKPAQTAAGSNLGEEAPAQLQEMLFAGHPNAEKLGELMEQLERLMLEKLELRQGIDLGSIQKDMKNWINKVTGKIIVRALEETFGNQAQAARLLGITPRALRYHLSKADDPELDNG